ncbi:hypothetical protein ACLQ2P_41670 [Actinomadura citrea]|uniref:hypothetical protein n=1 Tax=Actinomadura citrea TaxID=46158 RepID=UPI003CE4EE4F
MRRGLVGQAPDAARAARSLAETWRALRRDVRPLLHWRRRDARRNFLAVARVLLQYADWETLRARPGHALIAEQTGVCTRTVARYIDALHQWGYLMTTEVGTTPRIRAGRTFGRDPHHGEGNRAQEYRLCVPLWITRAGLEDSPAPTDAEALKIPQETAVHSFNLRTVHPSRSARSAETGKHGASRLRQPAGTARAQERAHTRAACARRPSAGKPKIRTAQQEWRSAAGAVAQVWQVLPAALTERLADHEAERLANELARQLTHRTTAELSERITRHWQYWRYKLVGDVVRSPIAMAHRMVRRDYDCAEVRCEDGWHLDRDAACNACHVAVLDRRAAQERAEGPTEAPSGPTPLTQADTPARDVLAATGYQNALPAASETFARNAATRAQIRAAADAARDRKRQDERGRRPAPAPPRPPATAATSPKQLLDLADLHALQQTMANATSGTRRFGHRT